MSSLFVCLWVFCLFCFVLLALFYDNCSFIKWQSLCLKNHRASGGSCCTPERVWFSSGWWWTEGKTTWDQWGIERKWDWIQAPWGLVSFWLAWIDSLACRCLRWKLGVFTKAHLPWMALNCNFLFLQHLRTAKSSAYHLNLLALLHFFLGILASHLWTAHKHLEGNSRTECQAPCSLGSFSHSCLGPSCLASHELQSWWGCKSCGY